MQTNTAETKARELFTGEKLEVRPREEQRPLPFISNFVVEELPRWLHQIRSTDKDANPELVASSALRLAQQAENLAQQELASLNERVTSGEVISEADMLLARLDVLMLERAVAHVGGVPGPNLEALFQYVCDATGRIGALTYEDVVLSNPPQDIRTFTNEEAGASEADFYIGHAVIENALQPGIEALEVVLNKWQTATTSEIVAALNTATEGMKINIAITGIIRKKMPVEHFKGTFRQYLGSHPARGTNGPSGAFTGRVPYLENLMAGETLPEKTVNYQVENLAYFPLEHQALMMAAMENAQNGLSVRQLIIEQGNQPEAVEALEKLSHAFQAFRNMHFRAVETHLPDVMANKEPGTGGSVIDEFLNDRRESHNHGFGSQNQ
jgi:hypothetical protein